MKKIIPILAVAGFLVSLLPAMPSHAQDVSGCADCAVGDPLGGGRYHRKKRRSVKKPDATAPASDTSAPAPAPSEEKQPGGTKDSDTTK
jgi:hypothetical protein